MNSVTLEQIDAMLDEAVVEHHIFFNKDLVVCWKLKSGFTLIGRAACVDPANFNLEVGMCIARKDAVSKLWGHEGYMLQNKLHDQGVL